MPNGFECLAIEFCCFLLMREQVDSLGISCSNNGICVEMLITPSETHIGWHLGILLGSKWSPFSKWPLTSQTKSMIRESVKHTEFSFSLKKQIPQRIPSEQAKLETSNLVCRLIVRLANDARFDLI